jgi:hypothetical protein
MEHFLPMFGNNSNVYLDSFKLLDIVDTFLFAPKNCDEERIM